MNRELEIRRLVELVGGYFDDAERCAQNKIFRPACVMVAAALEAGLLALAYRFADVLNKRGPWPPDQNQPTKVTLSNLCVLARQAGWLPAAPPGADQQGDDGLTDADVDDMLRFVAEVRNTAAHPGKLSVIDVGDNAVFETAYKVVKTAFDMTYWTVLASATPDTDAMTYDRGSAG